MGLDPDNVEALAHPAAAYGALGRFGEADPAIERAIRLDPMNGGSVRCSSPRSSSDSRVALACPHARCY